jgi:sugar transferase (PEP-CTERM/EpsH1 system associated)
MRHLARRHAITYLSFADPADAIHADGMREVAARVETVPRSDPAKGSLRFYLDAARHLIDPLPYAVGKYRSRAFAQRLRELLAAGSFDLIVCDFLFPAVNLPKTLPCPAVIFTHNVESEIWRRHTETATGLRRWLYRMQHHRMLAYEARTLRRFDGVLAVSDADKGSFARLYPGAIRHPVHVVPTGVDTEFFTPAAATTVRGASTGRLVFTGSMDWLPNEDAMQFFCRDILPLIRQREPRATLSIVGRAPTPAVQRLADIHGVIVTGRVDDVRPFLEEADVYVVPLRIGGGTRLKIFEAMAIGRAVVSTTVGAEGLPVTSGEHLLRADDPQAFADAVVDLFRDPARRDRLAAAARALVRARYDWSAVAGELEEALTMFATRRTRSTTVDGSLVPLQARAD